MAEYDKIFGVGLNKTGTTSLAHALNTIGFNCLSWDPRAMTLFSEKKISELYQHIALYEGFVDWPWPLMVNQLLDKYGERGRYILTKRQSPRVWLESLKRHAVLMGSKASPREKIYGYRYPHENEAHHIDYYQRHNAQIHSTFKERGLSHVLLEVCWENGDGWQELCRFLSVSEPSGIFPHLNVSSKR